MRLFVYYALHTFKNQIKKLFKTWVLVFLAVCVGISIIIGIMTGIADNSAEEDLPQIEEPAEDEESFFDTLEVEKTDVLELAAGGIVLAVLVFTALGADKSGSLIFKPADVNLLFSSPMRPQSVLLFRLATQFGVAFLSGFYMLAQIPALKGGFGMSTAAAAAIVLAWCLTIAYSLLIRMLLYTLSSAHLKLKKLLRPAILALPLLAAGGFALYRQSVGGSVLKAAVSFFNAPFTRFIPVWGWLKGLCVFAAEGNTVGAVLCLAALALGFAAIIYAIWHIKADFYEDAMAKSEDTAVLMEAARSEGGGAVAVRRKKERSERIRRDGFNRGRGANVFFFKTMYNRFRFAHLGVFTKTLELYIVLAAAVGFFVRRSADTKSVVPIVFALAVCVFYRTLGNPLEQDTSVDYFRLVPESSWAKLFWSLAGGTVCCVLDVLPALIVGALFVGSNPFAALLYVPLLASLDFYATNVGAFIGLSVPVSAGKTLKQVIQLMFVYFGLIPDIIVVAFGYTLGAQALSLIIAALINTGLGFLFFAFSPSFLEPKCGRVYIKNAGR